MIDFLWLALIPALLTFWLFLLCLCVKMLSELLLVWAAWKEKPPRLKK